MNNETLLLILFKQRSCLSSLAKNKRPDQVQCVAFINIKLNLCSLPVDIGTCRHVVWTVWLGSTWKRQFHSHCTYSTHLKVSFLFFSRAWNSLLCAWLNIEKTNWCFTMPRDNSTDDSVRLFKDVSCTITKPSTFYQLFRN